MSKSTKRWHKVKITKWRISHISDGS